MYKEITASYVEQAGQHLRSLVEACEPVAGGSEDGSGTWKSSLPSSAKLADILKLATDTNRRFHKDGDERSQISEKLEKAMRLI